MLHQFQIWYRDLKNFCLCRYHRKKGKLTYPNAILPKFRYRGRIDIEELNSIIPLIIVRRSDLSRDETFNQLGKLREDVLESKDLVNMSMNLLGGKFISSHIKFKPNIKTEAARPWEGKRILLSEFMEDYEELNVYTPIYFNVTDLKREFPGLRDKNKDSENMVKKLKCTIPVENGQYVFIHKSQIEHSPLNLNYWHVELRIYDYNQPPQVINNPNKINKNALEYMLKHVVTFYAFSDVENIQEIPKRSYA